MLNTNIFPHVIANATCSSSSCESSYNESINATDRVMLLNFVGRFSFHGIIIIA